MLTYKYIFVIQYDISLPVDVMYEIVSLMREQYGEKTNRIVGYGHFGDGK